METARKLIEAELAKAEDACEIETWCQALRSVRDLVRMLRVWDDHLSDLIADVLGTGGEVEGVGLVEVKRGAVRKAWDHDRLTSVVVAAALDERQLDEETGEYEREATAVARALRDCAGVSYWKIGGLKKRGISADDFCESSPGRISVVLP